ncbi:ARM repeat-containing protein [Gloeophyllum trabeum ATCC 11539]|uniref:ARM repeat-containing protein n=1 Tax=Gloeophyllum trabeum (strain ATCC 11539 / FP-39264 / Madison 617) TaxID=670483 RepID=S7RSH8_GLOTA|nr:ARM repeat-containing protein [Gloeophyllum trabeum ATCC 11539]EPQ57610.1 ARM repeat-containing protein [Gloeophyllum trabeum ATCC 11539]
MENTQAAQSAKADEEHARRVRRANLRKLNTERAGQEPSKALDSSLKRHTALIKRIRQSVGADNREQILKDIDALSLEKYVEEIVGAVVEGTARCKTEKDVWSAVEVISALHRRFPKTFTPSLIELLAQALTPPNRAALASLPVEQREKEDATRVARQRPVLRVCAELALVGIIRDAPGRSGAEWVMKTLKELLSNDPTLSSLPLLSTFLKSYSRPYLGIVAPAAHAKQISAASEPGTLSGQAQNGSGAGMETGAVDEDEELVEKDIRDRFKRMCEMYFETVAKKLVIEHKRLQEQDRKNHEAYIRSGEIFEDRQQAYEKMTKSYEKLLASCQTLSELLYMPMPELPTVAHKSESILIGAGTNGLGADDDEGLITAGGKWEDEEERQFFEDILDLKDMVPRSVLGIEEEKEAGEDEEERRREREREEEEVRRLEREIEGLGSGEGVNGVAQEDAGDIDAEDEGDDDAPTPVPGSPRAGAATPLPDGTEAQGPSQLLTALLARLPDCTNRALIDQAAVDFAFLNSKAARKRLVKFLSQVPKNRTELLPHYSRLVATLNRYMPDVGTELVAILDEEFRYLQRKKKVVKELHDVRVKNITFISNLTKFRVVPTHLILHIFKVCLDDFSGTNVDNIAMLLEGCGRFLLRSDETKERFAKMLELMKRKQSLQHFDQRQQLMLENAYYQCNPPERAPRQEKERTPMELFIRHLIYDVLSKKSIDKVLKLIRKLDWDDAAVRRSLHKVFTKPWKIKYSNIGLLAMLTYDLQRYHPEFSVAVVDQVLEDIRRGLEQNVYSTNQRRVATMRYLGELYIYRLLNSSIIFDTFWSLVTFGHPEGRPLPRQPCPLDMPDDFFRIRLVCTLLDTCGMCFDRGSQKRKLDNFLTFFQYYMLCKEPLPMDVEFMVSDSIEAVRPELKLYRNVEQAAIAVDEMFSAAFQEAGLTTSAGDDSGEESGDEDDRPEQQEDDGDEEQGNPDSPVDDRAPSPETVLVGSISQEHVGPTEDEDAEFAKELAKMLVESSAESKKVDRRTAQALWDSSILPPGARRRRGDEGEGDASDLDDNGVMKFTLVTKRGNKPQTRSLAVPAESALAVQTRTAQMQDKVEQQHLKRLVLDYEQREEAEELKALETRTRGGAIKIRIAG